MRCDPGESTVRLRKYLASSLNSNRAAPNSPAAQYRSASASRPLETDRSSLASGSSDKKTRACSNPYATVAAREIRLSSWDRNKRRARMLRPAAPSSWPRLPCFGTRFIVRILCVSPFVAFTIRVGPSLYTQDRKPTADTFLSPRRQGAGETSAVTAAARCAAMLPCSRHDVWGHGCHVEH